MPEAVRSGDWIQTATRQRFWPLDPRSHEVVIDDIAHALSNLCRFIGHCRRFYSVAQHSVLVSHAVSPELALCGLLHDAAEAYLGDVARPLKRDHMMISYRVVERNLEAAIAERFGLPWPFPAEVKTADDRVLIAEARDLMGDPDWGRIMARSGELEPWPAERIQPFPPERAFGLFTSRYRELVHG